MEDTIAWIKVSACIAWPICLLLIVFIFRKKIRTLLLSLIRKQIGKMNGEETPVTQILAPPLQGHAGVISQEDTDRITSDNQLTVEACKNISSGKYFVVLDENNDEFETIAPNGNKKCLKKKMKSMFTTLVEKKPKEKQK